MNSKRDLTEYLGVNEVIDWTNGELMALAKELSHSCKNEEAIIKRTFDWVRDNIQHSLDFQRTEVTCRASDVLAVGTRYCYATESSAGGIIAGKRNPSRILLPAIDHKRRSGSVLSSCLKRCLLARPRLVSNRCTWKQSWCGCAIHSAD